MDVFIVPYDKTTNIELGFTKQKSTNKIWTKYNDIGIYVDKEIADKQASMQQIIPYTIIRSINNKYYTAIYKNKDKIIMSIGFGNNITSIDGTLQPLFKGAVRTLLDDVNIKDLKPMKYIGTVRDMLTNPKQLGYVFLIDNMTENISLINSKLEGKWLTKQELIDNYSKLEGWSKHVINYLVDNVL